MGEESSSNPEERLFVFYRCISFCNSSRLHLRGEVVIVLTIRRDVGVLARAVSPPLMLHSKTSYRPQAPRLKWVDLGNEPRKPRRRQPQGGTSDSATP
eukprot:m51a1_g7591 hypothetical protein (98) ;mRNA; f:214891-215240